MLATASGIEPIDPDWLLSSIAQSAAALVAIVGGFLVSRLVALSAERGGIIRRKNLVAGQHEIKQKELMGVTRDRFAVSKKWFLDHYWDDIMSERGDLNVDTMLADFIPRGSSEEEMRPVAEEVCSIARRAFDEIEAQFPDEVPSPGADELRDSGVRIPSGSEEVYERVANYIGSERGRHEFTYAVASAAVLTPNIVYERQDRRIDREGELSEQARGLDQELSLIDLELLAFSKPEGVLSAVLALVYLALMGIVLPTVLMALRPVPAGPVARGLVVLAFISGLAVLLAYFVRASRSLRLPDTASTTTTKPKRSWHFWRWS